MVRIPGGEYRMGAAKDEAGASDDDSPQREVTVPEFWLGKYTVTQAQWQAAGIVKKAERDSQIDFACMIWHGNVWEWCLDGWHDLHKDAFAKDCACRLANQKKSLRGGSFFYLPTNCRSAYSLSYPFHSRSDDIGFRVVCLSPDRSALSSL
ncbi:hypothetical protein BH23CYA1_BH23CYA1_18830 [soil metagenome]